MGKSKHRKGGFKTLKLWLKEAEVVFIREERVKQPMVVMTFDRFVKLLGGSPLPTLLAASMLWASPVLAEDAPVTYKLMMKGSTSTERTTSEVLERGQIGRASCREGGWGGVVGDAWEES